MSAQSINRLDIADNICQICLQKISKEDFETPDGVISCQKCNIKLHHRCCAVKNPKTFMCACCGWGMDSSTTHCILCNKTGGFMMTVPSTLKKLLDKSEGKGRFFMHDICAQPIQVVPKLANKNISGIDFFAARRQHTCIYCEETGDFNFPIHCLYPGCENWYHASCALDHDAKITYPYKCHIHKDAMMMIPRLDHTSDDAFVQKLGLKGHQPMMRKSDVYDVKNQHNYMQRMFSQEIVTGTQKKVKKQGGGIDFDLITELYDGYINLQECVLYSQGEGSSTKTHDDRNEEIVPAKVQCKIRHCYRKFLTSLRFGSLTYKDLIAILFKNNCELAGYFNADDPYLFTCDDATLSSRVGFKSWFGSRRGTTEPPPVFIVLSLGFLRSTMLKLPLTWSMLEEVEGVDDATMFIFRVSLQTPQNKDAGQIALPTLQTLLIPMDFSNLHHYYTIHPPSSTNGRGPRTSNISTKLKSTMSPSSNENIGSFYFVDPIEIGTHRPYDRTEPLYNTDVALIPMQAWHAIYDAYETIEFANRFIMYREDMLEQFITLMNCYNIERLPVLENNMIGVDFIAPNVPIAWNFNDNDSTIVLRPLSFSDLEWEELKIPKHWIKHSNRSYEVDEEAQSDYGHIVSFYHLSHKDITELNIEATRLFLRNQGRHFIVPVHHEGLDNRAGMLRMLTVQEIARLIEVDVSTFDL